MSIRHMKGPELHPGERIYSLVVSKIGGEVHGTAKVKISPEAKALMESFHGKDIWAVMNSLTSWMHTQEAEWLQQQRMEGKNVQ